MVVRFLALLELFKQGLVDLHQAVTFGDIEVEWIGVGDVTADVLAGVDDYESDPRDDPAELVGSDTADS